MQRETDFPPVLVDALFFLLPHFFPLLTYAGLKGAATMGVKRLATLKWLFMRWGSVHNLGKGVMFFSCSFFLLRFLDNGSTGL